MTLRSHRSNSPTLAHTATVSLFKMILHVLVTLLLLCSDPTNVAAQIPRVCAAPTVSHQPELCYCMDMFSGSASTNMLSLASTAHWRLVKAAWYFPNSCGGGSRRNYWQRFLHGEWLLWWGQCNHTKNTLHRYTKHESKLGSEG